jgi:hypothetical protein
MQAQSAKGFSLAFIIRSHTGRIAILLALSLCLAFLLKATNSVSGQTNAFGPRTYTLNSDLFGYSVESFNVANTNGTFIITIQNGDSNGGRRVRSGKVILNRQVFAITQQTGLIQRFVSVQTQNSLNVRLVGGDSNSFVTVTILKIEANTSPTLTITSPASGAVFRTQPIRVEGTIDLPLAQVTVNGVAATVNNGRFVANNVPLLRDGTQTITAVGTIPGVAAGQASITVALDTLPPTIVIDSPPSGFVTADETIAVAGMVSDVITVNPTVTVNGVSATVSNGNFIAMGVPLNPGQNQIAATARDGVGNQRTTSITVTRAEQPGLRLLIEGGQAQTGVVNTALPTPLTAKAVDGNGNPLGNREVTLQVVRGDGTLRNSPPGSGQTGQRTLILLTDTNGRVATQFTLGSRTGAGNNRVQASVAGGLSFVEFCATATSAAPDRISIIPMSNQQTGVVNRPLADRFAAVVSDVFGNPVAGVPVTFLVSEGGGNLGGSPTATMNTGADGVAKVLLTLGPEPGTQNNVVKASFQGQTTPPVEFVASGRSTGAIANTTFTGIVLDNGDRPLRNARALILDTDRSALTDAQGRFTIANVPPGAQRLFIEGGPIADTLGRIFPDLEFDVNVIGGAENSLPFPIYLPPLATDSRSVATITGPATTAIVLEMPGVPAATLTLLPGTIVSNHTGPASQNNPITVRLSRVNNDRVPMPPPNGSVFMLAGTVQPAGTHFDPPARICIPNAGMPPGAQVDIFSFDHDVGRFLSIGMATVSEDGSTQCSNPGFGISKAGWWGCTPPPPPDTEPKNCRVTNVVANPNPVCIPPVVGPAISDEVVITATTDPTDKIVTWGGDLGVNPVITGNTVRTRYATPGEKMVTATCEQSSKTVTVRVAQVTDVMATNATRINSVGDPNILHFVTPKATGDITLTANINPNTPETRNAITWEGAAQDAANPLRATISRATAARHIVRIRIGGQVCKELRAWVVWSSLASSGTTGPATTFGGTLPNQVNTQVSAAINWAATIMPSEVVTDADRPDLAGANTSNPPGSGTSTLGGLDLSGGVNAHWDISRRIRQRYFINGVEQSVTGIRAQIAAYPADGRIGNDDGSTGDEDNDPYSTPGMGALTSIDTPVCSFTFSELNVGDTIELRIQFGEFARLELDGTWHRISDFANWRLHINIVKVSDDQLIPFGQGGPNFIAITSGTNGVLDTSPSGDDVVVGRTITSGPNGIAETSAIGDDVQVISVGRGQPNINIIGQGADGALQTGLAQFIASGILGGDDMLMGNFVIAGANGIAETRAVMRLWIERAPPGNAFDLTNNGF